VTLAAETVREKMRLEQLWVREALEGRWFGELRTVCDYFIASCASRVRGTVRWQVGRGTAQTRSIVAERPRYIGESEGVGEGSALTPRPAGTDPDTATDAVPGEAGHVTSR
jgi:argininosuccinate synthase